MANQLMTPAQNMTPVGGMTPAPRIPSTTINPQFAEAIRAVESVGVQNMSSVDARIPSPTISSAFRRNLPWGNPVKNALEVSDRENLRNFQQKKLNDTYNNWVKRWTGRGRELEVDTLLDERGRLQYLNRATGIMSDLKSVYDNLDTWAEELQGQLNILDYSRDMESAFDKTLTPDFRNVSGDMEAFFNREKQRLNINRPLKRSERNALATKYMNRIAKGVDPQTGDFFERLADSHLPAIDISAKISNTLMGIAQRAGRGAAELKRLSPEDRAGVVPAFTKSTVQGAFDAIPLLNKLTQKKVGDLVVRGDALYYDGFYVGNLNMTEGERIGTRGGQVTGGLLGNIALYTALSPILEAQILRSSAFIGKYLRTPVKLAAIRGSKIEQRVLKAIDTTTASGLHKWAKQNPLAFRMSLVNLAEETVQATTSKLSGYEYTKDDFYMGMLLGGAFEVVFSSMRGRPKFKNFDSPNVKNVAMRELEQHVSDYYDATGSFRNVRQFSHFMGDTEIGRTGRTWNDLFQEHRLIYYNDPNLRRKAQLPEDPEVRFWSAIGDSDGNFSRFEPRPQARRVKAITDVDAFSYKGDDGRWHVVEERSGVGLTTRGGFDTKGAAIVDAQANIARLKAEGGDVRSSIQKKIDAHGTTPAFKRIDKTLPKGDPETPKQFNDFLDDIRQRIPVTKYPEKPSIRDADAVQHSLEMTGDDLAYRPVGGDEGKNLPDTVKKVDESPESDIERLSKKHNGDIRKIKRELERKHGVEMRPERELLLMTSEARRALPADFKGSIEQVRGDLKKKGISDEAIDQLMMDGYSLRDNIRMDESGRMKVDEEVWTQLRTLKDNGGIVEPPDPRELPDDFWGKMRGGFTSVMQSLMPTEVYANMVDKGKLTYDGPFMRMMIWPVQDAATKAARRTHAWSLEHSKMRGDLTPDQIRDTDLWGLTQMDPPAESAFRSMREYVQVQLAKANAEMRKANPEHVDIVIPEKPSPAQQKIYDYWRNSMDDIHPELKQAALDSTGEDIGFIERYLPIQLDRDELINAGIIDKNNQISHFIRRRTPDMSNLKERRLSDILIKMDAYELMERYMEKAHYFIEMGPLCARIKHFVEQPEFGDIYGAGAQKYFRDDWIQDVLRGNKTVSSPAWKAVAMLRTNLSRFALSFRGTSIAKQAIAALNTSAKIDLVSGKPGTGLSYLQSNIGKLRDPNVRKLHLDNSQHLMRRLPDIAFERIEKPKAGSLAGRAEEISEIGLKPLKVIDFEAAMLGHIAAKEFAVRELGMSFDDAMRFADSTVRTTQGSTELENLPKAFKNDMGLVFLQFNTFVNANFNFVKQDLLRAGLIEKGAPPSAVASAFSTVMVGVMMEKAISDEYYKLKTGMAPRFSGNMFSYKYFSTLATDFVPGLSATAEGSPIGRSFGNLLTSFEAGPGARQGIRAAKGGAALFGVPGGAQMIDLFEFGIRQ